MNNDTIKTRISQGILAAICGVAAVSANAAGNTFQTLDPQEIIDFNSGYDISRVEYTLIDSETLQIDLIPYGVPGDADGDGDPDASSNPAIADSPGVSGLETIYLGMICNYTGGPCVPNLDVSYYDNTLTAIATSGADVSANLTFQLIDAIDNDGTLDTYRLTINNLSTVRTAVLGFVPAVVNFGSFTFSAHFDDSQPDDMVPDADATTGEPVCETISLVPPDAVAPGTGTIGYWKNHPNDWPTNCDLTLPGSINDPNAFAMKVLESPVRGDKTVALAKQLVAAKLNVCAGNESACIDQTIAGAMTWLQSYPVFSKQKSWMGADVYHEMLEDYNEGKLCAPHMPRNEKDHEVKPNCPKHKHVHYVRGETHD
ncbi:MAG: hypothetical protein HY941_09670 [Gammaproteobacteria bacterium]|nr:hypothetical protein [Gammaproteobacteria bacterium]